MSAYKRRPASEVNIGGILIGDGHPVAVQSMTCLLYTSDAADE